MTDSNQYRAAGVNIDAGNALVARIKAQTAATVTALAPHGAALLADSGGFAAAVRLPSLSAPVLLACADGVGTKVALLAEHDSPHTAGLDVVAMCVNDLLCAGAQPLIFLDYYACDSLSPDFAARVIDGVAAGCKQAGCALVGGETAEMPGVYAQGAFDLAGFAVGLAEESALLPPHQAAAGDVLLAIASSGPHSNGYSLIRRILQQATPPSGILADLLAPTRIYCRSIAALRGCCSLRGLAHITGGGLTENLPRILPAMTAAQIKVSRPLPPVFAWLQQAGKITLQEMWRVFNCGIGMVAVVPAEAAEQALACLQQNGEDAWQLGEVIAAASAAPPVVFLP